MPADQEYRPERQQKTNGERKALAAAQFDRLADKLGCQQAKVLPAKAKAFVMCRLSRSAGATKAFADLALRELKKRQRIEMVRLERDRVAKMKAAARRQRARERDELLASLSKPVSRLAGQAEHLSVLAGLPSDIFFRTREWRRTSVEALNLYGRRCMSCGAVPADESRLRAVHIASRLVQPDLAFDLANLRILCTDCHVGFNALARAGA